VSSFSVYSEGSSFLYRLDPRTKLLMLLCVVIVAMLSTDPVFNACLFAGCMALAVLAVDYKKILNTLKIFVPLFAMVLFLWPIFMRRGPVLFSWGILVVTQGGLVYAVAMFFRILTMLVFSMITLMTIKSADLVTIMDKAGLPYTYSYAAMISLNFLPEFATAARTVLNAQQARGLDVRKTNFILGIKNLASIMPPLMSMVFRKAETLSLSMDSLAFGASPKRTFVRSSELVLGQRDWVAMAATVLLLIVYVALRILL